MPRSVFYSIPATLIAVLGFGFSPYINGSWRILASLVLGILMGWAVAIAWWDGFKAREKTWGP